MWCNPCRAVGIIHCAHPDECGNMLSDQAAADNWKAWIDDLPLDAGFAEGIGQVQDFISGTVARAEAAEAERDALRAELDKWMERCGRERAFASSHRIRAEAAEAKVEKLRGAGDGLHSIVEGIQGAMQHGTWRDEKGQRLKDTPEWVAFYNARAAITEATQ